MTSKSVNYCNEFDEWDVINIPEFDCKLYIHEINLSLSLLNLTKLKYIK